MAEDLSKVKQGHDDHSDPAADRNYLLVLILQKEWFDTLLS